MERYTVAGASSLPKARRSSKRPYSGKVAELGKAATVTMAVNGNKVADGRLPKTS